MLFPGGDNEPLRLAIRIENKGFMYIKVRITVGTHVAVDPTMLIPTLQHTSKPMLALATALLFTRRADFSTLGTALVSADENTTTGLLANDVNTPVNAGRARSLADMRAGKDGVARSLAKHG